MVPAYQNCRCCWTSTIFWTEIPSSETSPRPQEGIRACVFQVDRRISKEVWRTVTGHVERWWKVEGWGDFDQDASDICRNMVRNHAFNRKYGDLMAFSHTCWILASWATQKNETLCLLKHAMGCCYRNHPVSLGIAISSNAASWFNPGFFFCIVWWCLVHTVYCTICYRILCQWEFQDPKLEVPTRTLYKAYVRPMWGNIPTKYGLKNGTEPPFWVPEMTIDYVLKKICPFVYGDRYNPIPLAFTKWVDRCSKWVGPDDPIL